MKQSWIYAAIITSAVAASGCASNDSEYVAKLRQAVASAETTFADAIRASEAEAASPVAGELSISGEFYSVRAVRSPELQRFRFSFSGDQISEDNIGSSNVDCSHAISASEAIAIAEVEENGTATGIEQENETDDDDVACTWEVQVLNADALMEVEIGPDGTVLETEISDEDGTGEDDDD